MKSQKISCIVPTFKRPYIVTKTIKSALRQNYKNLEVIVVDDHSCDETSKEVKKIIDQDYRVKYYYNHQNLGLLRNFKKAISLVETDFFSVLGDDDLLLPNFYDEGIKLLEQNQDLDFIIFQTLKVDQDLNLYDLPLQKDLNLESYNSGSGFKDFLLGKFGYNWEGIIFRNRCKEIYSDIDKDDIDFGHDINFLLRLFSKCSFMVVNKPGAAYVYHDNNYSKELIKNYDVLQSLNYLNRFRDIILDKDVPVENVEIAKQAIADYQIINLNTFYKYSIKELIVGSADFDSKRLSKLINEVDHLISLRNKKIFFLKFISYAVNFKPLNFSIKVIFFIPVKILKILKSKKIKKVSSEKFNDYINYLKNL